jgi:hypothetical protein
MLAAVRRVWLIPRFTLVLRVPIGFKLHIKSVHRVLSNSAMFADESFPEFVNGN